jgi:hypothetical protein
MVMRLRELRQLVGKAGPYLLLEILLPGGTLFALLLFLYQRRQGRTAGHAAPRHAVAVVYAIGRIREAMLLAPGKRIAATFSRDAEGERDGLEPLAVAGV